MDLETPYAIDVPAMAPEQTVDAVFADLATALEALCATTQSQLFQLLMKQNTRLIRCEQKLQRGIQSNSELLTGKRAEIGEQQRAIEGLETCAKKLQQQLRKEKQERGEEKKWIVQLWPDGLVLPTLLKPFEPPKEIAFVKDADDSERLQACMNRRVARERVIQQIEAAQQWKVVVMPATTDLETGEMTPESVYYMNVVTGESVWQAPLAMVFEPPPQWDHAKMDWKDSYGIEYFFDRDSDAAARSGDGDTDSEGADRGFGGAPLETAKPSARDDGKDDSDGEIEEKPADPIALREQMTQELEKFSQLQKELAVSQSQQRSLALQLLNASRDTFEREKEALEAEDEEVKIAVRRKRKALLQEQAAAKAKIEAQEKKNSTNVQAKFSKDSMGKKDLVLSKDGELFEQELEEFVLQERAGRSYLAAPVALDPRVKFHHQLDEEYVHMKTMEAKVLEIEQLEFDLLEKSSLRHEESKAKGDEMKALCEEIRIRQPEVDQGLQNVLKTIARLEISLPPPTEPRPSEEELQRASVRFVTVKTLDDDDDDDNIGGDKDASAAETNDEGGKSREKERQLMVAEVAKERMSREEIEALLKDEAELLLFKSYVDAEQHWRDWEKEEAVRVEELAQVVDRRKSLENLQRQLALDLALYESDAPFFTRLSELEKELNTRMWQIQADSQIERVRFMIERAAREEAIFQMDDRFEELKRQLEVAQRMPLQAINLLQRLELEEESRVLCDSLGKKISELEAKYSKEMEAKKLLVELESRSCGYAHQKLKEEMKLFSEKQALWDLNFALGDEMQAARKTIERLYLLMEQQQQAQQPKSQSAVVDGTSEMKQLQANQQQQEEATAVFEAKFQSLEQVRQFMLTCYDREARWRNLASIALIKDCSSEKWMTSMQHERHESMMAILQEQHDAEVLDLRKQIKLLQKVKAVLHSQIDELNAKIDRIQFAYQESSDHVRQQTENVIHALNAEIEEQKQILRDEQKRAAEERQRLIGEHNIVREELEARLLELEGIDGKQRHWLTAAKRELNAQRIANEELVKAYQSLEKRRAAETNDMRFRISSQIKKINNIEMWNLSLKLKAKEAHVERIQMQKEMDWLVEQHRQQQQLLRLKNWRHRVAAQAILTDVDLLFTFFTDGLEILSGATPEINSSLRANGAIEVMATLAQHCHQTPIKIICAKALGRLAWNANTTQRSLGWQAKRQWFAWVTAQSDKILEKMGRENVAFDAVANEESVEMNWLADPSNNAGVGESDCAVVSRKDKKVQFVKSWHQFDELKFSDENSNNQEYMGLSPSILKTVIDLCRTPVRDPTHIENGDDESAKEQKTQIQRNALLSLALIVMNSRNTAIIGRMNGSISLLVGLIEPKDPREDTQVLRNAINALSNLAFQNKYNQLSITSNGAIPHLVSYCDEATDVDLILASTWALSHLSQEETSVCEAIFDAGGIAVLTRLCHSPRIYDTVELDIYELIQTRAAEIIANVVTILDNEDNENDHRSRNVASVILEEEELQASTQHGQRIRTNNRRRIGGVTSFVLMCASCNRDVAFHAALVLGSIAQHDPIRAAIGNFGGIDALFLLADRPGDKEMMVQATWALANLTWNRDNQYRVARYFDHLFSICILVSSSPASVQSTNQELESASPEQDGDEASDDDLARQIREHGLCILANALFYNDANRQLVASQYKWMELIQRNCIQGQGDALEHSARALCSLSYSDTIALAMGATLHKLESNNNNQSSSRSNWELPYSGLEVFIHLCGCATNPLVQQNGLFGVINMCLHDANKTRMLDVPHGIETLVNLSGSTNKELCDPALEALELLADVNQLKKDGVSSTSSLAATDIKKLIALLSDATNPALVAMISDAIADEVWKKPSAKVKLRNEHGLEKLLELCVNPLSAVVKGGHSISHDQEQQLLISCLWALRNTIADNVRNQDLVGALDGVEQLVMLYDRQKRSEEVVEAILAVLVSLVMKHPRNSQQLVQFGLDMLISLAKKTHYAGSRDEEDRERTLLPPLVPTATIPAVKPPMKTAHNKISSAIAAASTSSNTDSCVDSGRHELQNAALARDLLHLVTPYNMPPSTASAATTTSPDKLTKMRRFQQMQAASLHQQQHQKHG